MAVESVLGGELVWVADNDPGAAKILAHRFPDVPNLGDITAADWAAAGPVDILTAGFPCQDVSCAGARKGLRAGNRTGVWAYVAQAIGVLRPSIVLLENVRGLLSAGADSNMEPCPWCMGESGDEHALRACGAVLGDLADLGFDAEWATVSAADAGAPHRRERVFIVAWPAVNAESFGRGMGGGRGRQGSQGQQRGLGVAERSARSAADPECGELQRRGVSGVLGGAQAGELGERDQRERAGHAAGDSGAAAAQDADCTARGERRLAAPGQTAGGRPWPDAGRSGGAPAPADTRGEGLEVGAVESDRDERQAAERSCGDAPADTYGQDAGSHAGGSGEEAPAGPGDGQERRGGPRPGVGCGTPADAEHDGFTARQDAGTGEGPQQGQRGSWRVTAEPAGDSGQRTAWGTYEPAIRRWERATGRTAPRPTEPGRTGERLSPRFVEFLMGLPDGWVTDVPGLSRNAQLHALGNGVVPQQCALALRLLLGIPDESRRAA